MRTAQSIEEKKSLLSVGKTKRQFKKPVSPNSLKNLRPFVPGVSGNPSGRPKNDIAREIAQAVFSQNPEAIYAAMAKALVKGNAYVFKELADRAYGKLKETTEVTHVHQDASDADLNQRIAELERELGLVDQINETGRTKGTKGRSKPKAVKS